MKTLRILLSVALLAGVTMPQAMAMTAANVGLANVSSGSSLVAGEPLLVQINSNKKLCTNILEC